MKATLRNTFHFFALLGIIFIPVSFYALPFQPKLALWFFGDIVNTLIEDHLDFGSDTLGLNILLIFLFFVAAVLSASFKVIKRLSEKEEKIINFIRVVAVYYLAAILLIYGFDKVFKTQFYLPEPNILYSEVGMLSKDILFWSVMGSSKWYCILSGLAEIVPAIMLLHRRTRIAGLVMLTFVMLHVLTINIGFDISVKLYSLFLLYLILLSLLPYFPSLLDFFFRGQNTRLGNVATLLQDKSHTKKGLKFFVIGMIFIEALKFPISTGYLSDDDVPRSELHGAYETYDYKIIGSYDISAGDPYNITRVFIHRDNFLIFEYQNGELEDFKLEVDPVTKMMDIENNHGRSNEVLYHLYKNGDNLDLGIVNVAADTFWVYTKRLFYDELPLLQNDFHWTIDAFKDDE